jgi:hypothetical protein
MPSKTSTPWGQADQEEKLDLGHGAPILSVSTPSHGGFFVPDEHLDAIPANRQAWAARWSGSVNWYEEDCCWAAVALAFPRFFSSDHIAIARKLVEQYAP